MQRALACFHAAMNDLKVKVYEDGCSFSSLFMLEPLEPEQMNCPLAFQKYGKIGLKPKFLPV